MQIRTPLILLCSCLCCVFLSAQNLVINPDLKDINLCCEYQQRCCPSAWFEFGSAAMKRVKPDKWFLPVSAKYYFKPRYIIATLFQELDTSCSYKATLVLPGNEGIYMRYAFTDSLVIEGEDYLETLKFDSVKLSRVKNSFSFRPKTKGKFIVIALIDPHKKVTAGYRQYINCLEIVPKNCTHIFDEETRAWRQEIYEETRRHSLKRSCDQTFQLRNQKE